MRLLAPHFRHKLFLTATPHNGDRRSFAALLELLDDQRFTREIWPRESDPKSDEIFQKRLTPVFVRRLKSDLVDAEGKRRYPERRLEALRIDYAYDERDARRQLEAYIKTRENGPDGGRAVDHFVHQLLRKRLSSSPAAFAATLERHIATIEGLASSGRSQRKFDDRILRRAIAKTEEDYAKTTPNGTPPRRRRSRKPGNTPDLQPTRNAECSTGCALGHSRRLVERMPKPVPCWTGWLNT